MQALEYRVKRQAAFLLLGVAISSVVMPATILGNISEPPTACVHSNIERHC
jgi:hypothetical protein